MSDRDSGFSVWGFIKGFGKLMIGLLLLLQGLIGLIVMLLIVGVIVSVANGVAGSKDEAPTVLIPNGAALVLDPVGDLVEQAEYVDPFNVIVEEAYGVNRPTQIEVHDLVAAIRAAKVDERIKGLVLQIGRLNIPSSSASKAHFIADELAAFKETGKPIYAVGDAFSQEQYILAAQADEIMINDFGNIIIYGYGRYNAYLKSFLEKLKVNLHVFRVGTFKSAVEPFTRDDMSPEAEEANRAHLAILWREYGARVEAARGLEAGAIDAFANNYGDRLRAAGGSFSKAALDAGLVDRVNTRAEQQEFLRQTFGADNSGKSFKRVGFRRYLSATGGAKDDGDPNIAVVTASGVIVDGQAPIGRAAGGDTVAALLRRAREDKNVKAVVLRVDSPGGSAFASDIIRDEIIALKAAGKPVVASMGSLAASGGYWIAAAADEIWASPTTITGSIGIFAYFPTFENTAAEAGIFADGVGTTELSPVLATGIGPLPDSFADILQQSIEHGYERFLEVVGEGRELDRDYVDSVGQGRVWMGETAKELKLVDELGDLDDAVAAAARLADLDDYDVVDMIITPTPFERLLGGLAAKTASAAGVGPAPEAASPLRKLVGVAEAQLEFFSEFNDPNAAYARCLACE